MSSIDESLLQHLPFTGEPILKWQVGTDLHRFLTNLYDHDGIMLAADGRKVQVNYKEYGDYCFDNGKNQSRSLASKFSNEAKGKFEDPSRSFDFYESATFGKTVKSSIAWQGWVGESLSSGTFFSLPHALESLTDLECSVELASKLYYKQASQTLRSFLESNVLAVYFAEHPESYLEWLRGQFRTPALRGRHGMLKELTDQGIIKGSLADATSALYDELNSFIHNCEYRLINSGTVSGGWLGLRFKEENFLEWCSCLQTAVNLAMQLFITNVGQWEDFRRTHRVVCMRCHNNKEFDTKPFVFGGEKFTEYTCRGCGGVSTRNYEGSQAYGQSFNGIVNSYQY